MPEHLTKSVKDGCICRMQKKEAMRARCAKGSGGPGFSCSLSTFTLLMRQNQMNIIVSLMKWKWHHNQTMKNNEIMIPKTGISRVYIYTYVSFLYSPPLPKNISHSSTPILASFETDSVDHFSYLLTERTGKVDPNSVLKQLSGGEEWNLSESQRFCFFLANWVEPQRNGPHNRKGIAATKTKGRNAKKGMATWSRPARKCVLHALQHWLGTFGEKDFWIQLSQMQVWCRNMLMKVSAQSDLLQHVPVPWTSCARISHPVAAAARSPVCITATWASHRGFVNPVLRPFWFVAVPSKSASRRSWCASSVKSSNKAARWAAPTPSPRTKPSALWSNVAHRPARDSICALLAWIYMSGDKMTWAPNTTASPSVKRHLMRDSKHHCFNGPPNNCPFFLRMSEQPK